MIESKIERLVDQHRTILGVGPMSVNCVDAVIELTEEYDVPIMLVASRRQIDSETFGGGYVNNWTTAEFADYVFSRDKKGKVILARDHGGPWQSPKEVESSLCLRRAMESAKKSYRDDIDAGIQILHIDPSVDIHQKLGVEEIMDRVFELYEFCWSYASEKKQRILFEIGTEEQTGSTNKQEEVDYSLSEIQRFCKKNHLPLPTFVVVQTGTRVMETRNVGSFDSPVRVADEIAPEIQVPKMVELCQKYGINIKAHNTDYLSSDALMWYPRLGIHAANVAPEFGVVETRAFIRLLEEHELNALADEWLKISYESRKWKKWMLSDTTATDRDRAIIAGHYITALPEAAEIKLIAGKRLGEKGVDLDRELRKEIKGSILRYMNAFRLVGAA
ncbi:MAG: class II D-tagatose-bisphosphate aldolase, non-catalytic subunit [Pontiellaceae bacterium]|nr:class II D-tagatose-bisphosphate aldolase, non-catalytic subunit [Pontiellaceae bacterium]MBN2784156.1 class II D-tagatose-bisphosphate aldolase, non-catalytic subunit [Pontiellaceae bacterium]